MDKSRARQFRRVPGRWLAAAALMGLLARGSTSRGAEAVGASGFQPIPLDEIRREVNLARSHPEVYQAYLEEWLPRIQGDIMSRPDGRPLRLKEGDAAVREAITFLRTQAAAGSLRPSFGMSRAAEDLAEDQARTGQTGHVASDGSRVAQRLRRYGTWQERAAELIQYGGRNAREIVALLIVDDGVVCRGHRTAIYDDAYRWIGVAGGPHARYRSMWVLTLAADFEDQPVFASTP